MKFTWARMLVFGLLVFVVGSVVWMYYHTRYLMESNFRPIDSFCSEIPRTSTPQQVIALAKMRGFEEDASGDENEVMFFNHMQGPYFRFICDVKFEDHKLISKETMDGD